MARQRVYAAGKPTPLQRLDLPFPAEVYVKREDLCPIRAYKWRGAFNRMATLTNDELRRGVVTASAGNHAQGVALAARKLGTHAKIFMPVSTPEMKKTAVARHGGDAVEIVLVGDSYDVASKAAYEFANREGLTYIHAYDDLRVMGGQGTLADEVVMSGVGPFDRAYLQIGGGGMASATACWLRRYYPKIKIIGVEGVDQASMKLAVENGAPIALDYVDVFCDGTAVREAGKLTWQLCRDLIDEFITVTNDEVCYAIRMLWDANRSIPEPAGAMGLAGYLQQMHKIAPTERVLTILCGANMDFSQFNTIARHAGIGGKQERYLRLSMRDGKGALADLLEVMPEKMNIIDLQFGKLDRDLCEPVFGLIANSEDFAAFEKTLTAKSVRFEEVDDAEDVDYRIIPYSPGIFQQPLFVHIEFPERPGAFLGFMRKIKEVANLCYFNYAYTGERVGRALIGMEFDSSEDREKTRALLKQMCGPVIRASREVSQATLERLIGVPPNDEDRG